MSFGTPATKREDIPIIETSPRQLPKPQGIPMTPFVMPIRVPDREPVPVRRGSR